MSQGPHGRDGSVPPARLPPQSLRERRALPAAPSPVTSSDESISALVKRTTNTLNPVLPPWQHMPFPAPKVSASSPALEEGRIDVDTGCVVIGLLIKGLTPLIRLTGAYALPL